MSQPARLELIFAAALLCLAAPNRDARAEPAPIDARVVWVRGDRVYIAAHDSLALEPGDLLTFLSHGKAIATGEVTSVPDGTLALARLTSGSLLREKRLERLRVHAARPSGRAGSALRIGHPAPPRSCLLFSCDATAPRSPSSPGNRAWYSCEVLNERSYRLVRDPGYVAPPSWPETLLVRLFDEAADEEIALERGELDVGVFWPGELSTHMRQQPRWREFQYATRGWGLVAAIRLGSWTPDDSSQSGSLARGGLDSFNQELFRGDLQSYPGPPPAGSGTPQGAQNPERIRWEVDPSCPGRETLERFLNRDRRAPGRPDAERLVRLVYLDGPTAPVGSLGYAVTDYLRGRSFSHPLIRQADTLRARLGRPAGPGEGRSPWWPLEFIRDSLGVEPLFTIQCPVVFDPSVRRVVSAMGASTILGMFECTAPEYVPSR